ncbi:pilus assembly protein PilM [Microbacterium sp. ARD31]|uniref:type IV pilus biogenesis protein PilM n=1 Tax=Microbacterium sp. ARD31 TaxID=2962576 RepID=UPI002880F085|nr:pilus assembly protein PilM [Microbacterium sp. ARD31]MDT0184083.1 pilus assembly protein PilM [Microbacterium sp. ARD31]
MAKTRIGLEITEEGVRGVEVTTGRSPSLMAIGEVPLPRDAARDSEVLDPEAVTLALRQLWSTAGFRGKRVTLSVGSRRILVREYTTQAMSPQLLKQALPYQVQDLLPVPVSQAVLDFYPTSQIGDQVSGLLVAAVAENIEQLIAALSRAKLSVDRVDLVPFGLARVGKILAAPNDTVAVIHLGDHTSYVSVVTNGIPHFVRIIPVEIATSATRRHEGDSAVGEVMEEAFEPVGASGIIPRRPTGRAAMRSSGPAVTPAVTELVSRLRSTVSFFQGREGAPRIVQVLMSGAGFLAPGVAEAAASAFDVPVIPVRLEQLANTRGRPISDDLAFDAVASVGVLLGEGSK